MDERGERHVPLDDSPLDPSTVRQRMRLFEDHNLAIRLQDAEYETHYDRNRFERRLVGGDTKTSKSEQEREKRLADAIRRQQLSHIAETDEEIARRLQEEIEKEEKRLRELQLKRDEELARRLEQSSPSTPGSSSQAPPTNLSRPSFPTASYPPPPRPPAPTASTPIRDLLTGDPLNLDEHSQNELNCLADVTRLTYDVISTTEVPLHTTTFEVNRQQGNQYITDDLINYQQQPNYPPPSQQYATGALPQGTSSSPSVGLPVNTQPRIYGVPLPGLANPAVQTPPTPTPVPPLTSPDFWPAPPASVLAPPSNPSSSTYQSSFLPPPSPLMTSHLSLSSSPSLPLPSCSSLSQAPSTQILPATPPSREPFLPLHPHPSHLSPEPPFSSSVPFSSPLETAYSASLYSHTNPFLPELTQNLSNTHISSQGPPLQMPQPNIPQPPPPYPY